MELKSEIKLENLIDRIIFFTDSYISSKHFDEKQKSDFMSTAREYIGRTEQFDSFETKYVRMSKARFYMQRAGDEVESLNIARTLVDNFEKTYGESPLHVIWAHYLDALEQIHHKSSEIEEKENSKEKLLKAYTNINVMHEPPQLSLSVWIRAPFRKYMLDGKIDELLKSNLEKYIDVLKKGEIDGNSMLYGSRDEYARLNDRSEKVLPEIYYISEHKDTFK